MEETADKLIDKLIIKNKVAHAYIIYGDSSENIFDYAKLFAKKLLCQKKYKEPCEECSSCIQVENNNHIELKIIATEKKQIKTEEIEELVYNFQKKEIIGNRRVYIINEAEKLTKKAANSMLKFLEEPESSICAVLTTTNLNRVLDTIKSRCQLVNINGRDKKELVNADLKQQIIEILQKIEENKLEIVYTEKEIINKICGENIENVFQAIETIYLNCLHKKINNFESLELKKILDKNSREKLIKKIEITNKFHYYLKTAVNANIIFDSFIFEISEV